MAQWLCQRLKMSCHRPCVSPAGSLQTTCCFCSVCLGGAHYGLPPLAHTPGLITTCCCPLTQFLPLLKVAALSFSSLDRWATGVRVPGYFLVFVLELRWLVFLTCFSLYVDFLDLCLNPPGVPVCLRGVWKGMSGRKGGCVWISYILPWTLCPSPCTYSAHWFSK